MGKFRNLISKEIARCSKLKSPDDQKDECPEGLEVSVSTLEALEGATAGASPSLRRGVTKTRLLTISTSGSCTVQDEPTGVPTDRKTASTHRKSLVTHMNPFPSIGKFKGTAEDKVLECILWLKRRGSDKKVKASKVFNPLSLSTPIFSVLIWDQRVHKLNAFYMRYSLYQHASE